MTTRSRAAGLTIAALASWRPADFAHAAPPDPVPLEKTCFYQLIEGKDAQLSCEHPMWLTDQERDDLKRITRDYLQDANCLVKIEIARAKIDDAMTAADSVFESPQQPVRCEIKTKSSVVEIKATFAPRVVFKGGVAVEGTPGLANVEGINKYLAWPVVQYVNRSSRITGTLLEIVNAYRKATQERKAAH